MQPSMVDTNTASAFLTQHLGPQVANVELVGEGAWSRCFGFTAAGREWVVRFGRHVDDFEKDRRAAGLRSERLPVPEVTEIGAAMGEHFAISTRGRGEFLEDLDAADWRATLPALFGALDAAREVDLAKTSGYGGWDGKGDAGHATWRDFLMAVADDNPSRRTFGWRRRLRSEAPGAERVFAAGLEALEDLAGAAPEARNLVHGDLINRNVLADAPRLNAVFDWGCSFYGDHLYDVAWLEFWAPWHPGIAATPIRPEILRHFEVSGIEVPHFEQRMRCCKIHIALDHQAYNAHTGDWATLAQVTDLLAALL